MSEKTIDGVRFRVQKLGFKQGRALFLSVSQALGPALGFLADAPEGNLPATVLRAVPKALEGVDEETLEGWDDVLGSVTTWSKDGSKWPFLTADNRETLFAGRLFALYFPWLLFALEVQFADFFVALGALRAPDPGRDTQNDSGA